MFFSTAPHRHVAVFYDAEGKARDVKIRSRLGMPAGRVTFEYDAAGRLTGIALYGWHSGGSGSYGIDGAPSRWRSMLARLLRPALEQFLRAYLYWRSIFAYLRVRDFVRARRTLVYGAAMFEEFRTYHDAGRIIEQRQVFCGGLSETTTKRSYDDRGFVLEQETYDDCKLSSRARFSREFDEYANWTKEIVVMWPRGCDASGVCDMQGEGTFVTYRTIEYGSSAKQ